MTWRRFLAAGLALVALVASAGGLVLWQRPGEFVVVGGCRMLLSPDRPVSLPDAIVVDLGDPALGVDRDDLRRPTESSVEAARRAAVSEAEHYGHEPADFYVCGVGDSDDVVLLRRREVSTDPCYGLSCGDDRTETRTCVMVFSVDSADWSRVEHCPDLTAD